MAVAVGRNGEAIFDEAMITSHSGFEVNFRCPYHANVMKTLETSNRTMGVMVPGNRDIDLVTPV